MTPIPPTSSLGAACGPALYARKHYARKPENSCRRKASNIAHPGFQASAGAEHRLTPSPQRRRSFLEMSLVSFYGNIVHPAASEKPREKRQGRAISCRPVATPPPLFFSLSLFYSSRSKHTSLVCRLPHPPPDHVFSETEKKRGKMNLKKKKKNRTDTRAAQSLFRDCGNAVVRVTGSHTYTCTDLVSSQSCCPLPALRADMRKRSGVQILRARVVG